MNESSRTNTLQESVSNVHKQEWETPRLASISIEDETQVPKFSGTDENATEAPPMS